MNQSIIKAMLILKLFYDHRTLSVHEVAEHMGEHKSNISRLMKAMAAHGLIYQEPKTKAYCLGFMVLKLAYALLGDIDLRRVAYPIMKKLNESCQESVLLSVLSGDEVVQVEQIASKHSLMVLSEIGKAFPLFTGATLNTTTGASARAIAAFLPWEEVGSRLNMEDFQHKIRSEKKPNVEIYRQQLDVIRKNGFAVAYCEVNKGVISISAPIFDAIDHPIASLTVIGPDVRMNDQTVHSISVMLKQAASECSDALRKGNGLE